MTKTEPAYTGALVITREEVATCNPIELRNLITAKLHNLEITLISVLEMSGVDVAEVPLTLPKVDWGCRCR